MKDLLTPEILTMSSLEISKLVEKRHDNVKRTVETLVKKKVIDQPQIEDGPKSANQVTIQIYLLEKRDSFIVVAQLSPEFTARLVDRWQELERQVLEPAPLPQPLETLVGPAREFRAALSLARMVGFTGNQAILSANKAARGVTGTDCLALMGATHLVADSQDILLTATELGERVGLSSRKINPKLEEHGLVRGYRDGQGRKCWALTEAGEQAGGVYLDTGKKHGDGTPVRQIKWTGNVVSMLVAL